MSDTGLLRNHHAVEICIIEIRNLFKDNKSAARSCFDLTLSIVGRSNDPVFGTAQSHRKLTFISNPRTTFCPPRTRINRCFIINEHHLSPSNFLQPENVHIKASFSSTYMMMMMTWVMCLMCVSRFGVLLFGMRLMMLWRVLMVVCMVIQVYLVMWRISRSVTDMNVMRKSGVVRGWVSMVARMMAALRLHQTKAENKSYCKEIRQRNVNEISGGGWSFLVEFCIILRHHVRNLE